MYNRTEHKLTYLDQELRESELRNQKLSDQDLESEFTELVKTERKITHQVLLYIQEIDRRSLHLALGYTSLEKYLIQKHCYSEGSACRRVSAMRMLKAVPEIKDKIIEGSLNLSQLTMAQIAVAKKQRTDKVTVSAEEKRELLLKIENQSMAQTQSCLADNLNIDIHQKKQITYGKEECVYLNLKLTKEEFEKAQECLDFISHQANSYKDMLIVLVDKFLKSKNTEVVRKNENKTQSDLATRSQSVGRTRFIPAALRKEIFKRDQWRCQYKGSSNHICGSQKYLQIHHVKAFAKGGANTKENLSLRCQAHNLYEAEQEGLSKP